MGRLREKLAVRVKTQVNDYLDQIEDPVKVVEVSLKEIGGSRDAAARALKDAKTQLMIAERARDDARRRADAFADDAKHAMILGDESRCREVLSMKVDADKLADSAQSSCDYIQSVVDSLESSLYDIDREIASATTKKELVEARKSVADAVKAASELKMPSSNVKKRLDDIDMAAMMAEGAADAARVFAEVV